MKRRKFWTAKEQSIAEVAAACGVSYKEIGRTLGRHDSLVAYHLHGKYQEKRRNEGKYRSQIWYLNNKDTAAKKSTRWHQENRECPRYKLRRKASRLRTREQDHQRHRAYQSLKRSSRKQAIIPLTQHQWEMRLKIWDGLCAYCGERKGSSMDHVLALSKGGLDEAANIVPACTFCNSSKQNKPVKEWYELQPFFSEQKWRKIQRHCDNAIRGQLSMALLLPKRQGKA
jgi:hypothetical protein